MVVVMPESLFRVIFVNQAEVYELYARSIGQSSMYGFIEVEELVFGERSALLVDPAEERLKSEFRNVKCSYLPINSVIRIDELENTAVTQLEAAKIRSLSVVPPKTPGGHA